MESTLTGTADAVQQIKHILITDLQLDMAPDEIPDNCSLMEGGLALDSILMAELIAQIEGRFGLQFDESVLDFDLFNNLSALADFVTRQYIASKGERAIEAGGAPC